MCITACLGMGCRCRRWCCCCTRRARCSRRCRWAWCWWSGRWRGCVLLAAVIFALGLSYGFGYLRLGPKGLFIALRHRRRTRQLLQLLQELGPQLQAAQTQQELDAQVTRFAVAIGLSLSLQPLSSESAPPPAAAPKTHYPVGSREAVLAQLTADAPESQLRPDEQILLQLLCDQLAPVVQRLAARGRVVNTF
jgi:hypothetical protein